MNRTLILISVAVVCALTFSSCVKKYDCHCTYVSNTLGPNAGQPNKEEHSTVEARTVEDADFECSSLESKYTTQFFRGTCIANR